MIDPGAEFFFGITVRDVLLAAIPFACAALYRRTRKAGGAFLKRPLFFSSLLISAGGVTMALSAASHSPATGADVLFIVGGLMLAQHGFRKAASSPDMPGGPDDQLSQENQKAAEK